MEVGSDPEENVESVFARALGRVLSDEERTRLLRLKDAFDLRPNDPLWVCAMMHESYDSIFRQYPALCAEAVRRSMKESLASLEGMAAALRGARSLAPGGHHFPAALESRRQSQESSRELSFVTLGGFATASLVLVGAVCFAAGASMQARGLPFWVRPSPSALSVALGAILGAPAGWIVFVALFVPAVYAGTWGWCRGQDVRRTARDRRLGWAACAAVSTAIVGWFVMVSWVTMLG